MRFLTAITLFTLILSFQSFAQAEQFKIRKHATPIKSSGDLPSSRLAVYLTDYTARVTVPASASCNEIKSVWVKSLELDKYQQHYDDLDWDFDLYCFGRDGDRMWVNAKGFVSALNEAGDKFLHDTYGKSHFFYDLHWSFSQPVSSMISVHIIHWNKNFSSSGPDYFNPYPRGFLNIPFHKADGYLNGMLEKFGAADPAGRRILMFNLLSELMPDKTADEINNYLFEVSIRSGSIELAFSPVFRMATTTYSENRFYWTYEFKCPDQICYTKHPTEAP